MIDKCEIINLPKIEDSRGNLTFVEEESQIPFAIKRVYYLYDVPAGSERGGHAHIALNQITIALAGSFDVELDDGKTRKTSSLNRPYEGLYICPGIWRELKNFSSGSVCLVLASNLYSEDDYYRDYDQFISSYAS